jgi:hypothetical protein
MWLVKPSYSLQSVPVELFWLLGDSGWGGFALENATRSMEIEKVEKKKLWLISIFPIFFGAIFTIVGVSLLIFLGILPVVQWSKARNWVQTRCTILSASIQTHDGDDGDTYSPEVRYRYQWKEINYEGTKFAFDNMSYGDRAAVQKWMAPFPVGAQSVCFVNPGKPEEAVLLKSFPMSVLFTAPIGLVFALIGLTVGYMGPLWMNRYGEKLQKMKLGNDRSTMQPIAGRTLPSRAYKSPQDSSQVRSIEDELPVSSTVPHETGEANEPLVMQPKMGRWAIWIGFLLFGLFWNGMLTTFLFSFFVNGGKPPVLMLIFFVPFVLVGLGLIGAAIYYFLGLFNPKPVVVCSDRWLYAGSEFELSWMMKGNISRIRKLTIFLEGLETVTYQQGTSTQTESNTFYSVTIAELTDSDQIAESYHVVQIPENTMHTFMAASNKIEWQIRFAGEIPWWPDVADTFAITILPPLPYRKEVS